MGSDEQNIHRRDFLKQSAFWGISVAFSGAVVKASYAASKERLTILSSVSLDTLHPYAHSSSPQYGIWNNMLEPLVEVNYAKRDYFGVLAESWEFQGRKWVFKLRRNVRFHDGSPFTAQDVIYSINRMKNDKESLQKDNFRDLSEMQAVDDHTVAFITKEPSAIFLDRLQNRFMLGKAGTEAQSGDLGQRKPIGTGPYRFVSWQRDGNLVVTRNDNYWGRKAAIKEIVTRRVKEDAGRVAGLLAGQGDVINNVPVEELSRFDKHPRVRPKKSKACACIFWR
jgi:peptide/nickel transport system substrate-binding protein